LSAVTLLVIIRRGEHLPMRSIGLGTARWWKSILWGVVTAVVSILAVGALAYVTGYGHGPGSAAFEKLPLWLITLIVLRAGVVEELFYRGYAIERLRLIGLGRFWSVAIPLVIFSFGHWSGGAANILIAFAAGLILTGFYLWRRDLVANMIGHGLVDFIANVLPALFS
jgi:membrane protease YdiL (CAAX protease family)